MSRPPTTAHGVGDGRGAEDVHTHCIDGRVARLVEIRVRREVDETVPLSEPPI